MSIAGSQVDPSTPLHGKQPTLRQILRTETADDHLVLDRSMAYLVLSRRVDLIRFLQIHLTARIGLEGWLARNAPPGWEPPPQSALIAQDLAALGVSDAGTTIEFDPDRDCDWVGPAYVIAGSHLGNRLLLAQCGSAMPDDARRFLLGDAMQHYWQRLRSLLSVVLEAGDGDASVRGARATFEHFRRAVDLHAKADLLAA